MIRIKILFISLLATQVVQAQTKKDWTEIVELIVSEFEQEDIRVYKRFVNNDASRDLNISWEQYEDDFYEKYKNFDEMAEAGPKYFNDSTTIVFEKIVVRYHELEKQLRKRNKSRLKKYTDNPLLKRAVYPYGFISMPIFSIDGERAIIYTGYLCGPLCGGGGIRYLEKVNGAWTVIRYERRWVS